MKRFISTIRQTRARWLLIYGVLAGLFFSSGEGIQLLPFPVSAKSKASKPSASSRDEPSKSYAFSVFSSRSSFTLLKSKVQKDTNQYLSGEYFTLVRSQGRATLCAFGAENPRSKNRLYRFPVKNSRPKRAPPVV